VVMGVVMVLRGVYFVGGVVVGGVGGVRMGRTFFFNLLV